MDDRPDRRNSTISDAKYIRIAEELVTAQRDIQLATEEAARARGVKAAILRRAKAEGADLDALDIKVRLLKLENPERALVTALHYAELEGSRVWVPPTAEKLQGALFDAGTEEHGAAHKLAVARAYNDGFNSGRHDGRRDANRHELGTELFVSWDRGFDDGEAERKVRPPLTGAKAPGGKKPARDPNAPAPRRGRPPKNAAPPIDEPSDVDDGFATGDEPGGEYDRAVERHEPAAPAKATPKKAAATKKPAKAKTDLATAQAAGIA